MEVIYKVCDVCGKSHGQMREVEGKVVGSITCWQEYWQREWIHWEEQRYHKKFQQTGAGALQFKKETKTAVQK
jgi:hypothetical protein